MGAKFWQAMKDFALDLLGLKITSHHQCNPSLCLTNPLLAQYNYDELPSYSATSLPSTMVWGHDGVRADGNASDAAQEGESEGYQSWIASPHSFHWFYLCLHVHPDCILSAATLEAVPTGVPTRAMNSANGLSGARKMPPGSSANVKDNVNDTSWSRAQRLLVNGLLVVQ